MATIPRTRSAVIAASALLIALVIVIALHRFEPVGFSSLAGKTLRSLHGPGFAAIAIAVGWGVRHWASGWWRIGLAFGICLSISLLAELSQVPGPRNAEIADIVVDLGGIVAGLAVFAALDMSLNFGNSPWTRRAAAFAALTALTLISMPTVWLIGAISVRNANLPVLLSFESAFERELYAGMETPQPIRVPKPQGWSTEGEMVGHATANGRWGTMLALAPYHDWRAYNGFSVVLASYSEDSIDVGIMLRTYGNSYYRRVTATRIPKRVRIDFADIVAKRPDFDLSRVHTLVVSAADPGEPYEVLFDDFRLED